MNWFTEADELYLKKSHFNGAFTEDFTRDNLVHYRKDQGTIEGITRSG